MSRFNPTPLVPSVDHAKLALVRHTREVKGMMPALCDLLPALEGDAERSAALAAYLAADRSLTRLLDLVEEQAKVAWLNLHGNTRED